MVELKQNNLNLNKTVGEIVAEDYRKASVFKKNNIDFCCGGGQSLEQACKTAMVDLNDIVDSLLLVESEFNDPDKDYHSWPLDKLIDYILNVHHAYVKENTFVISQFENKVKWVHGKNKPNVSDIADHYNLLAEELISHMRKEEMILFPYINQLVENKRTKTKQIASQFGTIQNPINMMLAEHDSAGEELEVIRKLTNDFKPPSGACATHTVSYGHLKDFEADLLQHIHLENNILFPRAIELENELLFK